MTRTGTLASIQTKILLSDTCVRDYLLDPDENRSAQHSSELRRGWGDLKQSLDTYAATPNTTDSRLAAQLRRQIETYWESISPSLEWSNRERRVLGPRLYNSAVLPSRVSVLEITAQIDQAQSRQVADGASQMASGFGSLRSELLWTLLLSLARCRDDSGNRMCAVYIFARWKGENRFRYDQVAAWAPRDGKAVPSPRRRSRTGKEGHLTGAPRRSGTDSQRSARRCRKPPKAHSGERCTKSGNS